MLGRTNSERGAAAVEIALVLPILVMLVFGIIQFSLAYNRQQGLHAAAREGARIASLPATPADEIEQRVEDALDGITFDSSPVIDTGTPCDGRSGDPVVVTVTVDNIIDIPLFGGPSVTLTGRGEFRCE